MNININDINRNSNNIQNIEKKIIIIVISI